MTVSGAPSIPLKVLPIGEQRYSCHGCGDCCRDFTVQLRERDLARLREQGWERELGEVTVEFRGRRYLRQRDDGACVFLRPDGRCRIHAEHGFEAKPVACQLFPFTFAPDARAARVGVSFACASVLESKGASLASHLAEVRRMAGEVDELAPARTMLDARTEATPEESDAVADAVERWMAEGAVPLVVRVDGLAWLAQQLSKARFDKVRGARLRELMGTLVGAIPDELPLCPVDPPTRQQLAALRHSIVERPVAPVRCVVKCKDRVYYCEMRINAELLDFRAFLAVLSCGSFHKAARELNISQPALSRRIKGLERTLGKTLIERSTRHVAPTAVGRQLRPLVARLLDEFEESVLSIGGLGGRLAGQVTIASVPTAAFYFLPRVIRAFNRLYPGIRFRILDLSANEGLDAVARGEVEFGINLTGATRPDLRFTPLLEDEFVLACRRDHPLASARELRWRHLAG